jgi:tetratricopeptide (TPR) repeat protein
MSCEYEQKNMAGLAAALDTMLTYYPSPDYWRDRIQLLQDVVAQDDRMTLETYRLALATGTLQPDEYIEMAEYSLEYGLPGEARATLEKGFTDQKLPEADKDRNNRLLGMAKTQADEDIKVLPSLESEAAKAADGLPYFKLGEAYISHGMYDKAVPALDAGIAKGGLKSADEANLRLGIAKLGAGKKDEAKKAFEAVAAGTPLGQLARLWIIFADKGPGVASAEVATE